ncbi:MAG TPA: HAD-IIA family hydrolase [Micromonospora sp.]
MTTPLVDAYDLVIFDLDGVIYLIDQPIPGAVEAVSRLSAEGRRFAFATNNASRRAADVAALLAGMGVPATADHVLTSAGAAAALLADRLPSGAPVLVVGAPALCAEVEAVGLRPVDQADRSPQAVVQGYGPQVGWGVLAEATVAIRAGALWVATNTDRTLPSPRGPLPGNGALVAAVRTAVGRDPDVVVGKPAPALFTTAARGASRPLVVGDRLDTDIEGAVRAGMDSLLVLTGVTGAVELLTAPAHRRPTYIAADTRGLFAPADALRVAAPECAGWRATWDGARLRLDGDGATVDALRALCAAVWSEPSDPSRSTRPVPPVVAGSPRAEAALGELGLTGGAAVEA